jgi:hypothetical protein
MSKIEKEFNQKAKQISIQPSPSAWPTLNERMEIKRKKKKKPKFIHFRMNTLIIVIIIILLICMVAYLVVRSQIIQ